MRKPSNNRTKPEGFFEPVLGSDIRPQLGGLIESGYKAGTIYADPPWSYDNIVARGAAEKHYAILSVDDIAGLPVRDIAADASHLHLWATNAFLFDAYAVIEAWGFKFKSVFVWVKPGIGLGNYWRVSQEFLLLGVRGKLVFRRHNYKSWIEWPRAGHSVKPTQVREMIEVVSPPPRVELFGRQEVPGWIVLGNQVGPVQLDSGWT